MDFFAEKIHKLENEMLPELLSLMKECKAKRIPVGDEHLKYSIAKMYVPYIKECLEWKPFPQFPQARYELEAALKLCREAKESLNAYLSGEKEALCTYRYVSSDLTVDGQTVWADMENEITGEIERRPFMGVGFGHFRQARKDLPIFSDIGNSLTQFEIPISQVITSPTAISWWVELDNLGGVDTSAENTWSYDTEVKKSGAAALKITGNEPSADRYTYKSQGYFVKGNTEYLVKLSAKAENSNVWISPRGLGGERISLNGTFDWTDFSLSFTTNPCDTVLEFVIVNEGATEACYIDDIVVAEVGTDENLIKNGDFESGYDCPVIDGMRVDKSAAYDMLEVLDRAEASNVSVNVLTAFHYFPRFLIDENPAEIDWLPELGHGGHWWRGFAGINLNAGRVRQAITLYLQTIVPILKDHKALNSLCVANEPAFCTGMGTFFLPLYHAFLKDKYNGCLEELNRNYKTSYASFDEVPFPKVRPVAEGKTGHFYDWFEFNNQVFCDFYKFYNKTIREMAPEIPLHLKLMSYNFGTDYEYFRRWLVAGTDAELVSEICDYHGTDAHSYIFDENQNMLTKMRWHDFLSSLAHKPIYDTESHIVEDARLNPIPEQAPWWGTEIWQGAVHGRSMSVAWSWEYSLSLGNPFYGSVMMMPEVVYANGKASLDLNRLSYEIKALQDKKPEVAVLYAAPSWIFSEVYQNATYTAWEASVFAGQKTAFVTEKQAAAGDLAKFKLLIVPLCNQVNEKTVRAIDQYVEDGGRVLIVGDESLKHNEYDIPFEEAVYRNIYEKSTVVKAENTHNKVTAPYGEQYRDLVAKELEALSLNQVVLMDTKTGKPAFEAECLWERYNGGLIINLVNFSWDGVKDVQLMVDGKKVERSVELRSNRQLGDTFELAPYQPILVFVEQ